MSGIIDLQSSGVITLLLLQAVIIGGWVVVTHGVKLGRLERDRGGASPHAAELRKLGIWLADAQRKQVATTAYMVETVAEIETATNQLDARMRSLDRRFELLQEDVTRRLDRNEAEAEELRTMQQQLEALPESVAERLERVDHRHNVRRPNRGRTTRRAGEGLDDDPLSFVQPA